MRRLPPRQVRESIRKRLELMCIDLDHVLGVERETRGNTDHLPECLSAPNKRLSNPEGRTPHRFTINLEHKAHWPNLVWSWMLGLASRSPSIALSICVRNQGGCKIGGL
jgi:hypothetical protein